MSNFYGNVGRSLRRARQAVMSALEELRYRDELSYRWEIISAFLRGRPILRCPYCNGLGGWVTGYWESEGEECYHCAPAWWEMEGTGQEWAIGRLGPVRWLRAKLARVHNDRQDALWRRDWEGKIK